MHANLYAFVSPIPAEDHAVWASTVGGFTRSRRNPAGDAVVLKWEVGVTPTAEELAGLSDAVDDGAPTLRGHAETVTLLADWVSEEDP